MVIRYGQVELMQPTSGLIHFCGGQIAEYALIHWVLSGAAAGRRLSAGVRSLLVPGLGFAIWTRVHIGRNWGSPMNGLPRADRPAFRITKTSEAVCVRRAVSEW
jgi:hypothetical protein